MNRSRRHCARISDVLTRCSSAAPPGKINDGVEYFFIINITTGDAKKHSGHSLQGSKLILPEWCVSQRQVIWRFLLTKVPMYIMLRLSTTLLKIINLIHYKFIELNPVTFDSIILFCLTPSNALVSVVSCVLHDP